MQVLEKPQIQSIFKTEPYIHQLNALKFLSIKKYGALLMEMGTGKTKVIIDKISELYLANLIKKVLVIVPNTIVENWKQEIEKHSIITTEPILINGYSRKKRVEQLQKDGVYYIINYEAVKSLYTDLAYISWDVIICDESTYIKNPFAQRTKIITKLVQKIPYRYIMSGMPITQSPIDIFAQYRFLNPYIFGWSFVAFRNQYALMGGFNGKEIIGYKNLTELNTKIYEHGFRITKVECLDLPDKIYETRYVDLTVQQKEVYDTLRKILIAEFKNSTITVAMALTKILRLSQITSGFIKNDDGQILKFEDNAKLQVLEEIIEETEGKIVIWTQFIENIKIINNFLSNKAIQFRCIYGEIAVEERQKSIDEFNNNLNIKVFIGQIRTGGLGINLTSASTVIYYSNSYSLENRLQSEDRCHRIGQKNNVTYIDIIARKTIDEIVLKVLKEKGDLATALIDNPELLEGGKGNVDN